ncbi:MAG TPA: SGNH/GDSL hydrolase family protein [Kiritimatiellia bacterium]|nr:SGNH/GDSL hydrolase family protein [Kiritimatiellia bacterium]HMP00499.1 SGNH/GDSL hydrolase family protein [Kiritimatiellia bacterium]HMP96403.1 SGNH/GDSL hydrolase family protein [Kiritimatiellia bacterium]
MKKIGLSLVALAFALLLAEGLLRLLAPEQDIFHLEAGMIRLSADPDLRYEMTPNFRSPRGDVTINTHGFRERDWSPEKPSNVNRIACIGDSIAFGMGAAQEQTFSRYLENVLNEQMTARNLPPSHEGSYEIASFGVPGFNITQVARTLETRVPEFQPDLVLYLYCLNDLQDYSRELENLLAGPGITASQRRWIERQWRQARIHGPRSELVSRVRLRFAASNREAAPADHSRDDMLQFLRGTGLEFYQTLYADPIRLDRIRSGFARISAWSRENNTPVIVTLVPVRASMRRPGFEVFHALVTDLAGQAGLETIDLLDVFRAHPGNPYEWLYADPLHPNSAGYRLAAEKVAEILYVPSH